MKPVNTKLLFYIIAGVFLLLLVIVLLAGLSNMGAVSGT